MSVDGQAAVRALTGPWVFVSDLHLDIAANGRAGGAAAAEFFHELADRADPVQALVLLGDVFEMLQPGTHEAGSVSRLDAIVSANAGVFSGLRRCVERGIVLEVVAGNHDIDIVRPAVGRRLRDHLGVGASDQRVRIWPWLYVVPTVLYAEHGNQHHDLNRFPRILDPYSARRAGTMHRTPLAAAHLPPGGAARSSTRRRCDVVLAVLATWRGERSASQPAYQARVERLAESMNIDRSLLTALERHSRLRPMSTARRLAAQLVRRMIGGRGGEPDGYVVRAAESVHHLCTRSGSHFPVFVFGHTHVAADRPLADSASRYLNCGTWSPYFRRGDHAADDPGAFPFVEVSVRGSVVDASLRWWRPRCRPPRPADAGATVRPDA